MNKKLKLGKKTVSLLLSALISFGAFCGIPISAAAEENNVAQSEELTGAALDEIDDYGKNKGMPLSVGELTPFVYAVFDDETIEIMGYDGNEAQLDIPKEIDGKKVTEIGDEAFQNNASLESVTIPDGVQEIDWYAFYNCPNLKSVTIPKSVTGVGYEAFGYHEDEETGDDIKVDGLTITGYKNSAAYRYAMENGFEFVSLGEVSPFVYEFYHDEETIEITRYNGYEKQLDIPAEIDGKKVTEIEWHAFQNCTSLESVTIPESVTYIGGSAFYDCPNLKSVTIPKSVTGVGDEAFGYYGYHYDDNGHSVYEKVEGFTITGYKNSAAYRYAMENGFEFVSLGEVSPFVYRELDEETIEITGYNGDETQLDIPAEIDEKKVIGIELYAFQNCTSLESVTIPDGVQEIDWYAFYNCPNLKSVTIPESVTDIGSSAFYDCPNLKSVTIPKSVTGVGDEAFGYYYDKETRDVTKVDGFTITGYKNSRAYRYAMENSLEFVSLGEVSPFVYESYYDETIEIKGYNGYESQLDIPEEIDGKSVTEIRYEAFENCQSLESVTIPESVTYIGREAFYACPNLKSVTIPASVTYIGEKAFYACPNLKSVTIPASTTFIGNRAFGYYGYHYDDNDNLVYEKVDDFAITGYKYSFAYAYARDNGFEFVSLGEISPFAYDELDEETIEITGYNGDDAKLDIPAEIDGKRVTDIDYDAFIGCQSLESVTIPESVINIGSSAFYNCPNLKSATIPASVTYIDNYAFGYCEDEETGDNIKVEGFTITGYKNSAAYKYAMENDFEFVSLGEVSPFVYRELDEETIEITGYNGDEAKLDIPAELDGKKVTKIGNYVFYGCQSLESVTIPEGVTNIDYDAFYGCTSLTSVTIPESMTYIGNDAFYNCTKLKAVTIPKSVALIVGNALGYCTGHYDENDNYVGYKVDGFTITGYKNSAAYAYARDNEFKFISLGEVDPLAYEELENGNLKLIAYYGDKEELTKLDIPAKVNGKSVAEIGNNAFKGCTGLESVNIPESVNYIGNVAFYNCSKLKAVTVPKSVVSIGYNAFGYCNGYYDENNNYVGYKVEGFTVTGYKNSAAYAYVRDSEFNFISLGEVSPFAGKELGDGNLELIAYYGDDRETMTKLDIPTEIDGKSVTEIRWYAFSGCTGLESVNIPKSVTEIGYGAFYGCTSLKSVSTPSSLKKIGHNSFNGCKSLENVTLSSGLTTIEFAAFYNCPKLKSVTIPASVTTIGNEAFGYYYDNETYELKKIEGFTIKGYSGTAAEDYAEQNGFKFVPLDEIALGDVDKDGKISISDAIIVQKQIVNILHLSDEEIVAADVDKNGQISISDAILIQKHIVSIIDINAM